MHCAVGVWYNGRSVQAVAPSHGLREPRSCKAAGTGGHSVKPSERTLMSTSRVKKPTQLTLAINVLDFCYLPPRLSLSPMRHNDLVCTVDCSWFFSEGANRMVIAERWNGTAMPGLVTVTNTSGAIFNPAVHPVFTLHVRAGYRMGGFADRMRITIHQGIAADGPVLFEGEVTGAGWGWDWTGSHKVAIAGIGPHFVTPNDTGCVEERVPRDAPNAILPFTNFKLRMVKG